MSDALLKKRRAMNHPRSRAGLSIVTGLCVLFNVPHAPASAASRGAPSQTIRITADLVDLPVSVTDRAGNLVRGLQADNFRIYEQGRLQQIVLFENQDLPITVGLVVDHSGSMSSKLPQIAAAAAAFAKSSNPRDELFVVNFNEIVSLMLPASVSFTSDERALERAVAGTTARGETALYEAVIDALQHLKLSNLKRQALIVVTDGGDNASNHTFQQMMDLARESQCQIYVLGLYDQNDRNAKPGLLRKLARETGGIAYFPASVTEATGVTQTIAAELRHQYILGFVPSEPTSNTGWRSVRVTAMDFNKKKLTVRTRSGYFFPVEPQQKSPG